LVAFLRAEYFQLKSTQWPHAWVKPWKWPGAPLANPFSEPKTHRSVHPASQSASGVSARSIERQTGNVFRQLRRPPLTVWPTGEAHTCILRGAGLTSSRGILRWQLIVVNNGV